MTACLHQEGMTILSVNISTAPISSKDLHNVLSAGSAPRRLWAHSARPAFIAIQKGRLIRSMSGLAEISQGMHAPMMRSEDVLGFEKM